MRDTCANCGSTYYLHDPVSTRCYGKRNGSRWFPKKLADALIALRKELESR